jgi:hypothetical protein
MRYAVVLVALLGCGDNRDAPPEASMPPPPDAAEPGLPYVQMPQVPDSNQTSEVSVAASGSTVVVVATEQLFPSADSFSVAHLTDDPARPFRRSVYMTSHDTGYAWDPPQVLDPTGHTDPVVAAAADGSFWASALFTYEPARSDLYHSTDGGRTFQPVANVHIGDKPWIAVDDARHAVWMAGAGGRFLIGFDGANRGAHTGGLGVSAAYADAAGGHFMTDIDQGWFWDGVGEPVHEGQPMSAGAASEDITAASIAMGLTGDGSQWIVHASREAMLDGPISLRLRHLPDEGSEITLSPPGTIGFLPAAVLDASGRLHAVWYDSSGATGRVIYAHSLTSDLQGAWSDPVVVDGNACPGNGWYPAEKFTPEGERRLREYIGIANTNGRTIIAWTHAPDPPSRVRVTYIDD